MSDHSITSQEAAEQLNGCEYGREGSSELWAAMKAAGLVAVFGASDDLMEFEGAIRDEIGAYEGAVAHVTMNGLVEPQQECCRHAESANAKAFAAARPIKAVWDAGDGTSWSYETDIPHATFNVMEDGDVYCRGIVFALADVTPQSSVATHA